jgi:hypothetical protein
LGSGLDAVEGGGVTDEMVVFVAEAKKEGGASCEVVGLSLEHWADEVLFFNFGP